MRFRLLTLVSAACVVCVLFVAAGTFSSGAGAVVCAPHCGGSSQLTQRGVPSDSLPCVREAGCGGGAALTGGIGIGLAVLAAGALAISASLTAWRRRRLWSTQPRGALLANGLFRPPRLLLDV